MRFTTLAVLSCFPVLACDPVAPPSVNAGTTGDAGQSDGASVGTTTVDPPADGDDAATHGATSNDPASTTGAGSSTTADPIDETTGEVPLDLGDPAVEHACEWLPQPVGAGPTPVWCKGLVPENADGATGQRIAVGPAGEIYVTGYGSVGYIETESRHGLLVRYSPDGEREWTHVFDHGTLPYDKAAGVAVAPGGDVLVGGQATYGPVEADHGWIARLSPDGVPVWDLDQSALSSAWRIGAHADGSFIVLGSAPDMPPAWPAARITRHAANGAVQWLYAPAGVLDHSENLGRAVGFDAAGNVYVAGTLSDRARFVTKLALDGTVLWEHVMPADDPYDWNIASDLVVTPAGDVFVSGHVEDEAWMARLTTDGMEVWSERPAPPGGTAGFGPLTRLPDGDLVVAGEQSIGDEHWLWLRRYTPDGDVVWDYTVLDLSVIGTSIADVDVTPEGDLVAMGTGYGVFFPFLWVARFEP